jgi:exopolysaccharide biosynthesis polyprenyl glycosylphosphotransferase
VTVVVDGAPELREWVAPTLSKLSSVKRHPMSRLTKRLKLLQGAGDAAALAGALLLAYVVRGMIGGEVVSGRDLAFGLICLPLWLAMFGHYRLYSARIVASRMQECSRLLRAIVASTIAMAAVSYLIRYQPSRGLVLGAAVLAFPLCLGERELVRWAFRRMRSSGRLRRRAVIIGANEEAESFVRMFQSTPQLGYEPVGSCSDDQGFETGVPWLGSLEAAPELVAAAGATTAVIATTSIGPAEANRVVRRLHDSGIHVELSAGLRDIPAERLSVRDLGRHAVFYLEPTVHSGWRALAKRTFDVSISLATLLATAPVLAVASVLVKLTSPGPVLFHQVRVGKDGTTFRMHKLRTMVDGADAMVGHLLEQNEADGPLFKLRNDPRVTRVGRVLRSLSIDELPQLWNVLKGEMSLVGPRPAICREVEGWTPELTNRLRVKPGVTGMWQVSGRSDGSFDDYVRHDLFYVDNWSLQRDLVILAKTIPTVVLRRGAC